MRQAFNRNSSARQGSAQKGGFLLGMIVGTLLGLAGALLVALYITKTPVPFLNKVPQRTAEQDAVETARNKDWDPNAALAGKAASGVVGTTTPPANSAVAAVATSPAPAIAAASGAARTDKTGSAATPAAGTEPVGYFIQVGAYNKSDDAEAQHAKIAMLGFEAKVYEYEQSGRIVYRVRVGPIVKKEDADAQQKKLEAAGVASHIVRIER